MQGRVVLITGAASGIGRESALALAGAGARLCLGDIDSSGGEETAQAVINRGGEAIFARCDVSRGDEVQALVKAAAGAFGRVDAAVNSAGIAGAFDRRIHEASDAAFERVMAVNVRGMWLCMKAELALMLEQGRGSIVNIASVAGLIGAPKGAAYTASKHAVVGLTKSAAIEYAKSGIRINAVCPAYVDTPMVRAITDAVPAMADVMARAIPMGRIGRPAEVADAVLWLCSDASSFVNGHALTLDGGLTAT